MRAQDVIVSAPKWAGPPPKPDGIPMEARFKPSFPRSMRKTDEISYVVLHASFDASGGRPIRSIRGSNAEVEHAVTEEIVDWTLKPAKRQGQPIPSPYVITVIFNPASAAPTGPNATPRLLAVTPITIAARVFQNHSGTLTIRARISIDAEGKVTDVVNDLVDKEQAPRVTTAIRHWKFAPARANGVPVAATLEMSVVPEGRGAKPGVVTIPPKVLKHPDPMYPPAMQYSRMRGEVAVAIVVAPDGSVQEATIASSNNPGFEDAALEAIRKWKFRAATRDGQPVPFHLTEHFTFGFDGINDGNDAYGLSHTGANHKLPAQYQYDVPPQIVSTILPVYPYALLDAAERGHASVTMLIGPTGRVLAVHVTEASKPEFGEALAAAGAMYQFRPALRAGKPTATLLGIQKDFDLRMMVPLGEMRTALDDEQLIHALRKHPDRLTPARDLDHPLHPVSQRAPVFPPQLQIKNVEQGSAEVELVVDDEGRARCPRVVQATEPEFGYAAAQAALYWRFDPPKAKGKTVMVRVQIPFKFASAKP